MCKTLLIEKYLPSSIFWKNLIRNNKIANLSVSQILSKYKGFEGEIVLFYDNKITEINFEEVILKSNEYIKLGNCLLLYVLSNNECLPFYIQDKAIKVGFDVGVCHQDGIFSSIFNEVIFGHLPELVDYKNFLNENLLFSDRTLAEAYLELHNKMSLEGKDVEDYMEMHIYEIWEHKLIDNQK